MSIRRYVREQDGNIYDRKARKIILVRQARLIGNLYYINPERDDEFVVPKDDIDEIQ